MSSECDKLDHAHATRTTRRQFLKAVSAGAAGALLALFRESAVQGDPRSSSTAMSSSRFEVSDIVNSANSITSLPGGTRNDPEGVAPSGAVKLITWKDSRNANRTMTLGAYLYQYDFSFDDGQQVTTRSANDNAYGHPGFGYVVSHNTQTGNSPLGKANRLNRE
jgi:hypothetical protein